eukprot:954794-Prymnesium_polylepis.2
MDTVSTAFHRSMCGEDYTFLLVGANVGAVLAFGVWLAQYSHATSGPRSACAQKRKVCGRLPRASAHGCVPGHATWRRSGGFR